MKLFLKAFRRTPAPPPTLSRAEALLCVPAIMPGVSWRELASGAVLIEYPLVLKPVLRAIFSRINKDYAGRLTRKLQLDELGSQVWLRIDGKRRVSELIREFASVSTMTSQEAEISVTTFLRELGKRGLIVLSPEP